MLNNKPNLILLNGPLGIGKSTLAKMYGDRHPLSLNIDMDLLRGSLGQWRERRGESAKLGWEMASSMSKVVLAAGRDVVIAQITLGSERFRCLEELAAQSRANLHEILLLVSKEEAMRRFMARGRASGFELGYRPNGLIDRSGGLVWVEAMYDRVAEIAKLRPQSTKVISPKHGFPEETYQEILAALELNIKEAK